MTQSVKTPISDTAGALADNRNLFQGSLGCRVCLCVEHVGAFLKRKKKEGVKRNTKKHRKTYLKKKTRLQSWSEPRYKAK